jgi:N-ethylmaleimide reductase
MDLFSPYRLGDLELANRIVLAPMTRSRAVEGRVPSPSAPLYYSQRAAAGLLITEATQVSPQGIGYVGTPGIHTPEQAAGWKKVTDAVHKAGGRIFLQLWHVGRISHPDFHNGALPVAPSAITPDVQTYTPEGQKKMVTPRALELDEISGVIEQFRKGAVNARAAGFDGVEIHGANGYLIDQFLRDRTNRRTDRYGGSIENRARLGLEVAEAVVSVFGASRVGYRLSPHGSFNDMADSNPVETFSYMAQELSRLNLGYLHVFEGVSGDSVPPPGATVLTPILRKLFRGTYMVNGGYSLQTGTTAIDKGTADLVAYGVPFLANPDLPARFRRNAPLNAPDYSTFYMGGDKGYIDYPLWDSQKEKVRR